MLPIIGMSIVLFAVVGVFTIVGGDLGALGNGLLDELPTVGGAALGAFLIANRRNIVSGTGRSIARIFSGRRYTKESYLELLSLLYTAFKLAKTKGMLALEQHVENPQDSNLFMRFPNFMNDQNSLVFLCDYLRLLTLGTDNPHEVETLMDEEIETHHAEALLVPSALSVTADGLPALGIVAAVLGVIRTMQFITAPVAVIGEHIGGALVGTLLGVLLAYGLVGPIASLLRADVEAELKYLQCMKAGILAHMQGYAPAVSVEFARKALMSDVRPTFYEVETTVSSLPPV